MMSATLVFVFQSSFEASCVPPAKTVSEGFASAGDTPAAASDGPMARIITSFGPPVMMKPPMS